MPTDTKEARPAPLGQILHPTIHEPILLTV